VNRETERGGVFRSSLWTACPGMQYTTLPYSLAVLKIQRVKYTGHRSPKQYYTSNLIIVRSRVCFAVFQLLLRTGERLTAVEDCVALSMTVIRHRSRRTLEYY